MSGPDAIEVTGRAGVFDPERARVTSDSLGPGGVRLHLAGPDPDLAAVLLIPRALLERWLREMEEVSRALGARR